ncbi:MAG: site-specific integrase, partial [Methylocystis sp.]|nr:site-specific integrase [Methylocystis sp.]
MRDSAPSATSRRHPLPAASSFSAAPQIAQAAADWLQYLAGERRASRHTIDAYARDITQFLAFLTEHFGARPDSATLQSLQPGDLRSFLARRRADGLENRSLLRALAAIRNFLRHLEKKNLAKTDFFGAVSAPKRPHSLPKALSVPDARDVIDPAQRAGEAREPWIIARDAAVMALLYGAGLRISEALSIARKDAPIGGADRVTILGKGGKTRTVPVIGPVRAAIDSYLALCPYDLTGGPLFV